MRAWEVRNGTLRLRDVPPPSSGPNKIVIRVTHTGICGSDTAKLRNLDGFTLPESWRPGHEIVGMDPTGRMVAVDPLVPCMACPRCAIGDIHLCNGLRRLGWDLPGGYADQVVAPIANVHAVPEDLNGLHAVLADPAAVSIHGLRCTGIVPPGRLAVIGSGTIGLLTALQAHQLGWAVTVIHRTGRRPNAAIAAAIPATFRSATDYPSPDPFDVVVDAASGSNDTPLQLGLRLVGDGGALIVQNAYHPDVQLSTPLRDLFRRSIRLIGSFSYCRRAPHNDFRLGLDLLHENANILPNIVTQDGDLAELPARLANDGTRGTKRVLTVDLYLEGNRKSN